MFEAVRSNKRIAQVILACLTIPFAFFGMEAYFRNAPGANEVAKVGGTPISLAEYENFLREQQENIRNARGGQVDRAELESPELRRAILEGLINQKIVARYSADNRLTVTTEELRDAIGRTPAFQENGVFSLELYNRRVGSRMSPQAFESKLAQDLLREQLRGAVSATGLVTDASARHLLAIQLEEREIREMRFPMTSYRDGVKLDDGAVAAYYEANPARFERPARLKADYLVFDEAAVRQQISVSDEEVSAFYGNADNAKRFEMPEERQVRHIQIQVGENASADEVAQAQARIEAIKARLSKNPAQFEAIAKESSQDLGSARRGGDLGFLARTGMLDKTFGDAAFSQAKGEIGSPVRSSFGFHIIQVTGIKPAGKQTLEEARAEIVDELTGQAARRRLAELAEQFSNTVYEQADSLQPAADALKLAIRHTDWIERGAKAFGSYRNEQLIAAVFSDDAVRDHRNTSAIDVGDNTYVSARVTEFEASQRLPLDQVKDQIEQQLRAEAAAKAAAEKGAAALATLEKGEAVSGDWGAPRKLQRMAPTVPIDAMRAVFAAPTVKLPAYVGVSTGDGYTVYRIDAVNRPTLEDNDPRIKEIANELGSMLAGRDFSAFTNELRQRYTVDIKPSKETGE